MQEQGQGKSVPEYGLRSVEYSDVQCYSGNFTDFIHSPLSYLQNYPDN